MRKHKLILSWGSNYFFKQNPLETNAYYLQSVANPSSPQVVETKLRELLNVSVARSVRYQLQEQSALQSQQELVINSSFKPLVGKGRGSWPSNPKGNRGKNPGEGRGLSLYLSKILFVSIRDGHSNYLNSTRVAKHWFFATRVESQTSLTWTQLESQGQWLEFEGSWLKFDSILESCVFVFPP